LLRIWETDELQRVSGVVRESATLGDPDSAFVDTVEQTWLASIKEGTLT
jgi:hypothetical protein